MKIDLVILASGFSRRFAANKLLYVWKGKPLIEHTLVKIDSQAFGKVIVVTQYAEIIELAKRYGFETLYNHQAELGISSSINLAVEHLADSQQIMFLVGDMPYLKAESLSKMINMADGKHIICAYDGNIKNPMIFPQRYFMDIMMLEKDQGAKRIALANEEEIIKCPIAFEELIDIDFQDDVA